MDRKYYPRYKEKIAKYQVGYYQKNRDRIADYYKSYMPKYYILNRDKNRKIQRDLKIGVLSRYSGESEVPVCVCCGESNIEFLTIDHIDGSGGKHRKEDKTATNIYRWLIRHNYPEGYRTLCMNCNWSLGKNGYCPHNGL